MVERRRNDCAKGVIAMFDRLFGSQPINLLEKALAGSSLRHKVISNNIANINTPGYKRMEVSFEEELAAVAQRETRQSGISLTHTKHLAPPQKMPELN